MRARALWYSFSFPTEKITFFALASCCFCMERKRWWIAPRERPVVPSSIRSHYVRREEEKLDGGFLSYREAKRLRDQRWSVWAHYSLQAWEVYGFLYSGEREREKRKRELCYQQQATLDVVCNCLRHQSWVKSRWQTSRYCVNESGHDATRSGSTG